MRADSWPTKREERVCKALTVVAIVVTMIVVAIAATGGLHP